MADRCPKPYKISETTDLYGQSIIKPFRRTYVILRRDSKKKKKRTSFQKKKKNRKPCRVNRIKTLCFVRLPPFGASVLEPRFDLRVGHLERFGQGRAVHGRQVSVLVELVLQLRYLATRERSPGLFPLGRSPVLVRVSDAPRTQQSAGTT